MTMILKKRILAFFRSVKLTVVLLALVALTCMVGTIVPQSPFPPSDVSKIGRPVQWYFRWHNIYRSPLLVTLLALLAVNVSVCSAKAFRRPTSRNIGWILTHASIVVILAGIVIGQLTGETGMIKLHEGESGSAVTRDDGTEFDLGFSVALDEFAVEYYDRPTERLIVLHGERERVLPVVVGRKYRVRDGSGSVKVLGRIPDATMTVSFVEDEGSEFNPAVRVVIEGNERNASGWLFAADEMDTPFFENAVSVRYMWCETEEAYRRALLEASSPKQEKLLVRVPGTDTVEAFPVEIGKPFPTRGTDYVLEILRYLPDFRLDRATGEPTSASDEPRNPAIEVKLSDGEQSLKRWAFAFFPEFARTHRAETGPDMELTYVVPADEVVRIVDLDGRRTMLVRTLADAPAEAETVRLGEKVQLAESGWALTLAERVARPKLVREVVPSLDHRGDPAIEVNIRDSDTGIDETIWLIANMPDETGNTRLLYSWELVPKQYSSDVRFVADGQEMKRGAVKVNAPLKYRSFAFYQSSYGNDGREFTVLQVKKDSGALIVYLGFVLLCVGLLYGLYIKPTTLKRRSATDKIRGGICS